MNRARRSQPPYFDPRPRPPSARGWELYHPWRHYPASGTAASRDRLIAHHEAGHAIAYVEFDVPFKKVWLEYSKTGRGFVEAESNYLVIPTPAAYEEDAAISLAGPFAQRRYAPHSHWRLTAGYQGKIHGREIHTPESDLAYFWQNINALIDRDGGYDAVVKRIEACTKALIKARWSEVKLIAAALLAHKTLTERQVYRLVKRPPRITYRRPPALTDLYYE
jgi:hypothetical protein